MQKGALVVRPCIVIRCFAPYAEGHLRGDVGETREVPQLTDAIYAHTLVIKSTHKYKVHGAPLWFSPTLPLNLCAREEPIVDNNPFPHPHSP